MDPALNSAAIELPPEEAVEYHRWFCAKVTQAITDPNPVIPHPQVMAEVRGIIAAKREKTASKKPS